MQKERKDKHFIKKPIYPGGPKAMRQFIKNNLQYPKEALENRVEGTVSLEYNIDYQGTVTDVHVISGIGFGCDEEAMRLVKLLKFEVPKTHKAKVRFRKTLQIHFRLPKQKKTAPAKISYTVKPAEKKEKEEGKKDGGYNYTINW